MFSIARILVWESKRNLPLGIMAFLQTLFVPLLDLHFSQLGGNLLALYHLQNNHFTFNFWI